MWQTLSTYVRTHERYLSAVFFVGGFLLDIFTLHLLTLSQIALLLGGYVALAALAILIGHALIGEREGAGRIISLGASAFPLIAQFFIGGSLSGLVIMYSSESSLAVSWPFILVLAGVFISTEAFSKYRRRLVFQTVLLFFTAYAYTIFTLPILLGAVNRLIFILSGAIALAALFGFLSLLKFVGRERVLGRSRIIAAWSVAITTAIHGAYFLGIIPPLPLTLTDKGVYHAVERRGDEYALTGEPKSMLPFKTPTIHYSASTPLYAFSAVFAPAQFSTHIVHKWQQFDTESSSWKTKTEIELPISGGRDGGYRTYSTSVLPREGRWRVAVTTRDGQVIGYIPFVVIPQMPPEVITELH